MGRHRQCVKTRFESNYMGEPNSGCWLWTGYLDRGYGQFRFGADPKEPSVGAHVASYRLFRGPIPKGLFVCHKCDVPACVNPAHLFLGTCKDNMSDAARKGLMNWKKPRPANLPGTKHPLAKLTDEKARRIKFSSEPIADLAREFGVSWRTVDCVRRGITWAHVQ